MKAKISFIILILGTRICVAAQSQPNSTPSAPSIDPATAASFLNIIGSMAASQPGPTPSQASSQPAASGIQTLLGLIATATIANLIQYYFTQPALRLQKDYPAIMFNLGMLFVLLMPKILSEDSDIRKFIYSTLGLSKVESSLEDVETIKNIMYGLSQQMGLVK